jgi:hypothetical protein
LSLRHGERNVWSRQRRQVEPKAARTQSPQTTSYYAWTLHKAYLLVGGQAIAAAYVDTFKEFPPRQKPQSFNLDRILEQLQHPAQSD